MGCFCYFCCQDLKRLCKCELSHGVELFFSPPARWGLLDFMSAARLLLLLLLLAGPHLPPLDRSGPRRTFSASSWSQWASPDLHCQLWSAVGLAGPPLPALERSGPRRTSTASSCRTPTASARSRRTSTGESLSGVGFAASTGESRSAVGFAGLQPARVWARWASPDFNRRESERCRPCQTATGESLRAVGFAGLQPDLNGHKQSHIECQRECQIECQIECQKICQIECQKICQKICQIECQKICQIECQKTCQMERHRISRNMPDRMSGGMNWMPWWGSLEAK